MAIPGRCSVSDAGSRLGGGSRRGDGEAELNHIEEVILGKIQQRVPSRMGEESYIAKACKFHDLGETGCIDWAKFKRAFAPFTMGIFDQDVKLIFDRYAANGSLPYKQFAAEFVRGAIRERGAGMPLGSEAAEQAWEVPEETLQRMKRFICSSGPRAVIGLAGAFREMDPDNARVVGPGEFHTVVSDLFSEQTECPVQEAQIGHLFQLFEQPLAPGQLAYDEFMQVFKDEPLSKDRRDAVRAAFRRLDTDSEGLMDIGRMMQIFNPTRHPQVCDGSLQAQEVVDEFVDTFQECIAYRRGQRSYPTNLVAWEEFEDYYKFISACYEADALFCCILQRVWDLDKGPNSSIEERAALARPAAGLSGKTRAGLHHWQSDTLPMSVTHNNFVQPVNIDSIMDRLRGTIAKRGLRMAVDVVKNFYSADDDMDDLLDVYDFRRACQQSGMTLREAEEEICFDACGVDPTGGKRRGRMVHLQRFLSTLHGELSPQRLELVNRAFHALGGDPRNDAFTISPAALKQNFCAEAHPLVVKGEMDAGILLAEFLDTFSLLAHVRGGCEGGMVSYSDFAAYYDVVSSTVESDVLFDLLMHRLWPIDAQSVNDQRAVASAESAAAVEPPRSPSKRDRWAAPVYEIGDQAVPRQRPPAFDGPSSYRRPQPSAVGGPEAGPVDTYHRFSRTSVPVPNPEQEGGVPRMSQSCAVAGAPTVGYSPITRSSIVFNETASAELGAVLERLRTSLARRGLKGWRMLGERMQQYDIRRNFGIMRGDWVRVHRTMGLGLSPEEQEIIFKSFAQGRRDGAMDYRECLRALRGPLNERRTALVGKLFDFLRQGQAVVSDEALKRTFDAKITPLCLVGTRDAASERQDFDAAVDHFIGGRGLDAQGFADFFAMLSSLYPEEDEFKLMTTTVFGLRGASVGGC